VIKLSDYVVSFLVGRGVRDVFLVSGGGVMHLLDSIGREERMRYVCTRHEQACAVAAEGYARATNRPGVCLVTTGPGGVNAVSGIVGAWVDSIPLVVLAGQVRRDLVADYRKLRQMGPQEGNVVGMAGPVTKYAVSVIDPRMIRFELERAFHVATSGRPGPTLVEIPIDVQGAMIDEHDLPAFEPLTEDGLARNDAVRRGVEATVEALTKSERPLFVCGNGIHLAGAEASLARLLQIAQVPVVLPDSAKDLVPEDAPMNMGIFGTAGQRRANFAVQNSDCFVALGAGLCVKKTGFNYKGFASAATKVIVDIDEHQLADQVITPDIAVLADLAEFLPALVRELERTPLAPRKPWLDACASWRQRYPLMVPDYYRDPKFISGYAFMDGLSEQLENNDVLVAGNGLDTVSYIQVFRVKEGQRTMTSANWGAMGWDLPLAIGACVGSGRRTICVTGDGSVQLNVQELATIGYYSLPIKVFIYNNQGFASIRATQRNLMDGRLVASDPASGVDNPDFRHLAEAFGLPYERIADSDDIDRGIANVLALDGPVLCEVVVSPDEEIQPKASSFRREDGTLESRPLEDMAPFLSRDELWQNMHLFDDEASESP
jgi:acetolactate synthase I/II/III large subunit